MDIRYQLRHISLLALLPTVMQGCALLGPAQDTPVSQLEFKDPGFSACVQDSGYRSLGDIQKLLCHRYGIGSAEEIRWMPNLKVLDLSGNQLTRLDTSNNPLLERLLLQDNKLTELDLTDNPRLQRLLVERNRLTQIELGEAPELLALYAYKNPVSELDLNYTPKLKDLGLSQHKLEALDLSGSPKLRTVNLTKGELKSLNLSSNFELLDIRVAHNQLTALNLGSKPELTYVNATQNRIGSLDLSGSDNLKELHAGQNQLVKLNLGRAVNLNKLSLNHNQFYSLDLSQLQAPQAITLFQNPLKFLTLPDNFELANLAAENTPWGNKHMPDQLIEPVVEVLEAGSISQRNGQYEVTGPRLLLIDQNDFIGIRYSVSWPELHQANPDLKRQLPIKIRVTHPALTPPNGQTFTVSEWTDNMYLHDKNLAMWQFTEQWEMVPGRWQFEVIYQDKVIARDALMVQLPLTKSELQQSVVQQLLHRMFSSEPLLCVSPEFRQCMGLTEDNCVATLGRHQSVCREQVSQGIETQSMPDAEQLKPKMFEYLGCVITRQGQASNMTNESIQNCIPAMPE